MYEVLFSLAAAAVVLITLFAFLRRYRRCPSDKILVVYGKVGRGKTGGMSAKCLHGGATFIWPLFQDYQFLDLTPMPIDINLAGALSLQNIRVNTPSTFTVGISTDPNVMGNAAERLLGLDMKQVAELARDIIFGQMRVVLATMPIEEINADRDKLIENITAGVEGELEKIGLRLINVNIQDITDESGYIDALGQEAAARAINEAKVKVSLEERDGAIGAADADRDKRIRVADAQATAVEGENEAEIKIAQSNAKRREQEAEAERLASAAEKVKSAQALEESYKAEEAAERQRAKREEASQSANVLVPAEIKKREIETLAEADAEKIRRIKKGEADGLRSMMEAEAEGLAAILLKKAQGFDRIVAAAQGHPELASLLMVTEQLPSLVEEQVKAISNLKIDSVTVWEGGRNGGTDGSGTGRTATADFVSGLVGSLPPLHELTKNVGIQLPEYLGRMEREPGGRGPGGGSGGGGSRGDESAEGDDAEPEPAGGASTAAPEAARPDAEQQAEPPETGPLKAAVEESSPRESGSEDTLASESAAAETPLQLPPSARDQIRSLLSSQPSLLTVLDRNRDGRLSDQEIDDAVGKVLDWAQKTMDGGTLWFYADQGEWKGPASWRHIRRLARERPWLPVHLERETIWLPYHAIEQARAGME